MSTRTTRVAARPATLDALEPRRLMAATYEVIQLSGPVPSKETYGIDISPSGQVLGTGDKNAAFWDKTKKGKLVHTPLTGGKGGSYAAAVNGQNTIVGSTLNKARDKQPAAWFFQKGVGYVPKDLGNLHKGGTGGALGVSDAGHIVGYSYPTVDPNQSEPDAFLASVRKGKVSMTNLNDYIPQAGASPLRVGAAWDVNSSGQIAAVGAHTATPGTYAAVLMKVAKKGSYAIELPTFGTGGAAAEGINEAGQVVGYAHTAPFDVHATLWSLDKKGNASIRPLGTLGGVGSAAVDINNHSQVVGWAVNADDDLHAFLWTPGKKGKGGTMIDLNKFLPKNSPLTLKHANGINDAGEIVCGAWDAKGDDVTVLLRPLASAKTATVTPATAPATPPAPFGTRPITAEEDATLFA